MYEFDTPDLEPLKSDKKTWQFKEKNYFILKIKDQIWRPAVTINMMK